MHLQPPHRTPLVQPTMFLAGSIEQDKADRWQDRVVDALEDLDIIVANPRREDWDPEWDQSQGNEMFSEQVHWELDHLEHADLVLFYFDPTTKSPISLLELGKVLETHPSSNIVVCCPNGFWRKGNVDITCGRKGVAVYDSLEEALERVRSIMESMVRHW